MYMCKVFPSNRKKLKKRKCDLHEISSASPKAVVPNLFNVMDPFEDFPESCGPLKEKRK